jgi:hypothetical protein
MVKWLVKDIDELEDLILSEAGTFYDGAFDKVGKENTFIFLDEEADARTAFNNKRTKIEPNDVQYFVNKLGLRGDSTFRSDKKKVAFFGCSFTFGWGINEVDGFPNIIGRKLFPDHEIINVGMPGTSSDTCTRYFKMITDVVDLDYAFILLPPSFRTELPCKDDFIKYANLSPNKNQIPDKIKYKWSAWQALNDDDYLKYRLHKNISFIDQTAQNRDVNVFFSTYDDDDMKYLHEVIDDNKLLPFFEQYELKASFDLTDFDRNLKHLFARDGHHPGIYSNAIFSKKVINKIKDIL